MHPVKSFLTACSDGMHARECTVRPMKEATEKTMVLAPHEQSGNPVLSGQAYFKQYQQTSIFKEA